MDLPDVWTIPFCTGMDSPSGVSMLAQERTRAHGQRACWPTAIVAVGIGRTRQRADRQRDGKYENIMPPLQVMLRTGCGGGIKRPPMLLAESTECDCSKK